MGQGEVEQVEFRVKQVNHYDYTVTLLKFVKLKHAPRCKSERGKSASSVTHSLRVWAGFATGWVQVGLV